MAKKKITIGRAENIDLPTLDIFNVNAKVDTGAYRSSLHCNIDKTFKKGGETYLKIVTTDLRDKPLVDHATVIKRTGVTNVKSSTGHVQKRPVVELPVIIKGKELLAEFTLSSRHDMRYPILLGRKLLSGHFTVDVSLPTNEEEQE